MVTENKNATRKPKKALREIQIKLKIDHPYGNNLEIKIESEYDEDVDESALTDRQINDLIKQLWEKMNGMKVTLLATIHCPNCKKPIDETDKKNHYHCGDCKITAKMVIEN